MEQKSLRILVAEDSLDLVSIYIECIEAALGAHRNISTLVATDGQTAYGMAANTHFDLILLDNNMPGKTGAELIKAFRAGECPQNLNTPIVFITGYIETSDPLLSNPETKENLFVYEKGATEERLIRQIKLAAA